MVNWSEWPCLWHPNTKQFFSCCFRIFFWCCWGWGGGEKELWMFWKNSFVSKYIVASSWKQLIQSPAELQGAWDICPRSNFTSTAAGNLAAAQPPALPLQQDAKLPELGWCLFLSCPPITQHRQPCSWRAPVTLTGPELPTHTSGGILQCFLLIHFLISRDSQSVCKPSNRFPWDFYRNVFWGPTPKGVNQKPWGRDPAI